MDPDNTQTNQQNYGQGQQSSGQNQQDDLFPGFLSEDSQSGIVPDFLNVNQQGQKQIVSTAGLSPESGGGVIEASVKTVEYGQEAGHEVSEKKEAHEQQAEKKETQKSESKQADPQKKQPLQLAKPEIKNAGPVIYGYMIPKNILKDFSIIKSQKGKGSLNSPKTWLYVLLDRIIKMHSQS